MRSAGKELEEIRHIPEHALLDGKLGGQPAQPFLELSEVLLARHQIGRPGLEDRPPARCRARREQHQEARLAGTRLPYDQDRAEWLVQCERLGAGEGLLDRIVLDEQLQFGGTLDEAAEGLKELAGRASSDATP